MASTLDQISAFLTEEGIEHQVENGVVRVTRSLLRDTGPEEFPFYITHFGNTLRIEHHFVILPRKEDLPLFLFLCMMVQKRLKLVKLILKDDFVYPMVVVTYAANRLSKALLLHCINELVDALDKYFDELDHFHLLYSPNILALSKADGIKPPDVWVLDQLPADLIEQALLLQPE